MDLYRRVAIWIHEYRVIPALLAVICALWTIATFEWSFSGFPYEALGCFVTAIGALLFGEVVGSEDRRELLGNTAEQTIASRMEPVLREPLPVLNRSDSMRAIEFKKRWEDVEQSLMDGIYIDDHSFAASFELDELRLWFSKNEPRINDSDLKKKMRAVESALDQLIRGVDVLFHSSEGMVRPNHARFRKSHPSFSVRIEGLVRDNQILQAKGQELATWIAERRITIQR